MVSQAELLISKGYHSLVPGLISIFFRDGMGPFKINMPIKTSRPDCLLAKNNIIKCETEMVVIIYVIIVYVI